MKFWNRSCWCCRCFSMMTRLLKSCSTALKPGRKPVYSSASSSSALALNRMWITWEHDLAGMADGTILLTLLEVTFLCMHVCIWEGENPQPPLSVLYCICMSLYSQNHFSTSCYQHTHTHKVINTQGVSSTQPINFESRSSVHDMPDPNETTPLKMLSSHTSQSTHILTKREVWTKIHPIPDQSRSAELVPYITIKCENKICRGVDFVGPYNRIKVTAVSVYK